jgi:hypothetical protein
MQQKKKSAEVLEEGKADDESYSSKKVEEIHEFLRSRTNHLYCHFLTYTVKVYDQVCDCELLKGSAI